MISLDLEPVELKAFDTLAQPIKMNWNEMLFFTNKNIVNKTIYGKKKKKELFRTSGSEIPVRNGATSKFVQHLKLHEEQ